MSKPRYAWWGYIRKILWRYPEGLTSGEREAIEYAIEQTRRMQDGAERMALIEMVFFRKTHTLGGAALALHCEYETAKRRQQQFIRMVGQKRGLMS